MNVDSFDLDFLSNETLKLSENLPDYIKNNKGEDHFSFIQESDQNFYYPEHSGLVFKIDRGINTFCIKGFPVSNIKDFFISRSKENLANEFSLEEAEVLDRLHYFPTDSIELAEVVIDHLGNKRFPIEEDILCNLSDPGFSWWMNIHDKGLQIYFKSHGIQRAEKFVRLGPISDNEIAKVRFGQLESILRKLFPVSEFSVGPKGISISSSDTHKDEYQNILTLLLKGECHLDEKKFSSEKRGKTLYLYLKELAHIRRFWINVEGLLEE